MLVQKGEYLARDNGDNTATLFEVLLADDEYFCVGEVTAKIDEHGEAYQSTDYLNVAIYSNREEINSLEDLKFMKAREEK